MILKFKLFFHEKLCFDWVFNVTFNKTIDIELHPDYFIFLKNFRLH